MASRFGISWSSIPFLLEGDFVRGVCNFLIFKEDGEQKGSGLGIFGLCFSFLLFEGDFVRGVCKFFAVVAVHDEGGLTGVFGSSDARACRRRSGVQ